VPRRPNVIPSIPITTHIPLDVHNQLAAYLYSPVEGCIPRGAYQKFFVERIREFFSKESSR
jgi:hypothetical protein